ncbi:hypothetical protein HQQ80_11890 [Microbacteriaceae bacterium VKM Ac-2855]|nr:hypothetical protein [Microbacteriaceae bacterium VKM Ac-2855]
MSPFRRTTSSYVRRPRAVWAALATGTVVVTLILLGVLLPLLGLIGAADGATAGALDVPVGTIAVALVVGYGLALAFLLLCLRTRNGAFAWVLAVAAVVATLLVSLWPIVAVAIAGVDQAQDIVPFIQNLIEKVMGN